MVYSNILDPIHKTLDPTVWDNADSPKPILKAHHRTWIINSITHVLEEAGYDNVKSWLDLVLTGSLTTYQYGEDSDCDISLFVNTAHFPEWSRAEMISVMVEHMDGKHLPGTTHPMQNFVVPPGIEPTMLYQPGLRSGYHLNPPEWIVQPELSRVHNIEQEMNASYVYALECADKMERLLQYEPDHAVQYWHMIHRQRQRDQRAGLGDFTLSNIVYKFLAKRGLLPEIAQASGEYIAKTAAEVNHQAVLDANRGRDLEGLPGPVNVPGIGPLQFHSNGDLQRIAQEYKAAAGINEPDPIRYTPVDPQRATAIAAEYDRLQHNPYDPHVAAAFDAFKRETAAQYQALINNGYKYDFYPDGQDPYPGSPRQATLDLHHNKHLSNYPTLGRGDQGYSEAPNHPMLEHTDEFWNGRPVTYNDMFRAVHDTFGHAKEGVGFRADGEDNAWRSHAAMYTPLARAAMTNETRGQNSWVNYGPHGENNRTALQADTIYPNQQATIMPDWAMNPHIAKQAAQNFDVDQDALEQARAHLELEHPVNINLVPHAVQQSGGYYSGRYQGIQNGAHNIDLVNWVKPETADRLLWHELTHAAQHERDPQAWKLGMPDYLDQQAQGYDQYMAHPWEMEANEKSTNPPFSLVTTPTRENNEQVLSTTQPQWSLSEDDGR